MTSTVSSRVHADSALAVYLEPHAEGRRVLLLGEAQGVLADRFDRLSTHLEIIDPAAREPSRGEVPELPFDDQSFDLVVVCDVTTLPEPAPGALRELHRVLARAGLLVISSPNAREPQQRRRRRASPPPRLDALLADEFRNVRVLGQTKLEGYAVGPLEAAQSEDLSIDSSLVREQRGAPERLIGLASDARLPLEPRVWIEVPAQAAGEPVDSEEQERAHSNLIEELRRAEDEAREALHRESDLLRKLESERRARAEVEHLAERAQTFERKLLAAEADYDDAVARVRYFEGAIGEHEATAKHEREKRSELEREVAHAKSELTSAREAARRAEVDRDAARTEYDSVAGELADLELRLSELGKQVRELEQDKRHHEATARDLLEELRRLEQDKTAAVEHDARVAELEAERDRAVSRSLEAEVAREAAQMRSDELRSELSERTSERGESARQRDDDRRRVRDDDALLELRGELAVRDTALARASLDVARQRGELQGAKLRLSETELALAATRGGAARPLGSGAVEQLAQTTRELGELRLRLSQTEAQLHAIREAHAQQRAPEPRTDKPRDDKPRDTSRELTIQLERAHERIDELTRELDEADRFAEVHAEDAERLASVEGELEHTRARLADFEEELRALEEDLRATRGELSAAREQLGTAREDLSKGRDELRQLRDDHAADGDQLRSAREELAASRDELRGVREELVRVQYEASRVASESATRLELSERREAERDDARTALAEARSILAQLAGRVGADANDPPSIVQALLQHDSQADQSERALRELRELLAQRDARISELETRTTTAEVANGEHHEPDATHGRPNDVHEA